MAEHTFDTKRLHCKLIERKDTEFVKALYTTPNRMTFICEPLSDESALKIVEKMLKLNQSLKKSTNPEVSSPSAMSAYWLITERESAAPVGIQNIASVQALCGMAEAGIILANSAEGKRYPFEALSGMFDHAFGSFELDCLIQMHQQGNLAVTRFVKKLGFSSTTECSRNGRAYFLSLLRKKDWLAARG